MCTLNTLVLYRLIYYSVSCSVGSMHLYLPVDLSRSFCMTWTVLYIRGLFCPSQSVIGLYIYWSCNYNIFNITQLLHWRRGLWIQWLPHHLDSSNPSIPILTQCEGTSNVFTYSSLQMISQTRRRFLCFSVPSEARLTSSFRT